MVNWLKGQKVKRNKAVGFTSRFFMSKKVKINFYTYLSIKLYFYGSHQKETGNKKKDKAGCICKGKKTFGSRYYGEH